MPTCAKYNSWKSNCNRTGCQLCDACNTCNNSHRTNPSRCNTAQNLCKYEQTAHNLSVGDSGAPEAQRDDIIIKILPRDKLNDLIQWIYDAADMGRNVEAGSPSPTPSIAEETRDFIYADKINEIIAGMVTVDSSNNTATVKRDQIITSETFNRIMEKIRELQINETGACDECVSGCNAYCDSCNNHNRCQGCYSCQCENSPCC